MQPLAVRPCRRAQPGEDSSVPDAGHLCRHPGHLPGQRHGAQRCREARGSSQSRRDGNPEVRRLILGGRASLPLSLAWVSQNTDFRTWRWNQYERHAEAFFLDTLRLDLVVTGVPANKPSSFRITCWGGSWLNSSSMI